MSTDNILNVKITLPDAGGDSLNPLTDGLSAGLGVGAGDAGGDGRSADTGASLLALGDDGSGTAQLGLADNPAALHYYTGGSKPITISFLPQPPTSDGGDRSSGALATVPTMAVFDDFGGGFSPSGGAAVDLFSKGGAGGPPGGGSGGGTPPPQYTAALNGMTFVVNWDSSVGSAPSAFVSGFESAVQYFLNNLGPATTPITITLAVGWGEVAGSRLSPFALGESSTNIDLTSFSALKASSMGSYLPASDPISGTHSYWVPSAEEKALGLATNNANVDGAVGFSSRTSWNYNSTTSGSQYDFVGTAEHEISEVMGRIGLGGGTVSDNGTSVPNSYTPFDLFRYSGPGLPAPAASSTAYFSFDGGNSSGATNLAGSSKTYFNTTAGGDISDWASSAGKDAYNAFTGTGATYTSTVDKLVMDVLGYGTVPTV